MVGFLKKSILSIFVFCLFASILVFALSAEKDEAVFSLSVDSNLYYGRSCLEKMENSENLLKAYDRIVKAVEKSENGVLLASSPLDTINVTVDEVKLVLAAYRFDNPQHFWFKEVENIYYYKENNIVDNVVLTYIDSLNTAEAKEEFNSAVQAFLTESGVNYDMSEYEISKILHDAVADHITYVDTVNSHNVYGALVEGKAVCEGYAELYQYLLYIMGIQSHIVTGTDLREQPHAWNLVQIDGEYYQTDITWDDQGESIYYAYFNTTTEYIKEDHIIDNNGYPIPECTSTEASFYTNGYGKTFSEQPVVDEVVEQLKYYGMARLYYTGNTTSSIEEWLNANHQEIAQKLKITSLYSYSWSVSNRDYILKFTGYSLSLLPNTGVLPQLMNVIENTELNVIATGNAGNLVIAPTPEVGEEALQTTDIQSILNNSGVSISTKKDGVIGTGSVISCNDEQAKIVVKGDVDGDGKVTVFDAMIIKKSQKSDDKGDKFTYGKSAQKYAADIDNNNVAEEDDMRSILSYVVGKSIDLQ